MRIDVVGKHLEITPAIREYAEAKCAKLPKVFDGTQQIRVVLESPAGRKNEFNVEIVVDVEKHEDFVSHASGSDLYGCIDDCIDKSQRQLRDFKEILKN
jgi:putative sigma-54 modulation protein